jgi:hypothetical protein
MKKTLTLLLIIVSFVILREAPAQISDKKIGAGIIFGQPTGLTFKSWVSEKEAVAGSIAWSLKAKEKLTLQIDFLKHYFSEYVQVSRGQIPLYYGVGSRLKIIDDGGEEIKFGLRGIGGIEYIFDSAPVEIFIEMGPVLDIIPEMLIEGSGGIGLRYYY